MVMGRLISKCRKCENIGKTKFFLIKDRKGMRKPTDDPRIVHLQVHHGMGDEIRLRKHFETAKWNVNLTEKQFNELGKLMKKKGWLR